MGWDPPHLQLETGPGATLQGFNSPIKALALYFRCCRKLKVFNRRVIFCILLWLLGGKLNDVRLRIEKGE